jgi:DamX protein
MAEAPAETERTFLGLTHNPFVEPHRGFFERGGRKTHLEQLRHLSEWSRRVLLVTGAEGVGKTTLYRELAATLEPRVKAARINGSLVNTGFEVLSATAQGFGLGLPLNANTQSLQLDLIEHVEAQTAADRLCLALVDDAHLLDNKAMESLIALAHDSGLHLVFFGEVRMVPMVERAASAKGVGWQEIRLTGYGEADARDYLEWRFGQAKYRGRIPFTDNEVKDLVKLSEGLPGRINQMANVLLVKLETGEGSPARGGFPKVHAALLTLLIVMVGLLYLVVGNGGGEEPSVADDDTASELLVDVGEPPSPAQSLASDGLARTSDNVVVEATDPTEESAVPSEAMLAGDSLHEPETMPEEAEVALAPTPVSETPIAGEVESRVGGVPAEDVAQELEVASPPVAEETPAEESPAQSSPAQPSPAQPSPVQQESVSTVDLPTGAKDTRWLLAQDPDYFTLQLVTVSSPESASAFVARQRDAAEFTVYQLQRDGRILHVVLYGLFSSRSAAEAAADSLPAEAGRVQPWIRPVGQVQDAARLSTLQ